MISKNRDNAIKPIVVGEIVSVILVLIGTALISYLILQKGLPEPGEKWGVMLLVFLAVMIGNLITIKLSGKKSVMTCVIFAGLFFVMQMIVSMLLFDGISVMIWGRGVAVLLGAVGSLAICCMGTKKRSFNKMRSR